MKIKTPNEFKLNALNGQNSVLVCVHKRHSTSSQRSIKQASVEFDTENSIILSDKNTSAISRNIEKQKWRKWDRRVISTALHDQITDF